MFLFGDIGASPCDELPQANRPIRSSVFLGDDLPSRCLNRSRSINAPVHQEKIMLRQTSTVAFLLTTFSIAVAMSPGCGGSTARKPAPDGGAGSGTAGAGTAGEGTAGAGTAGEGTAGAGTAGAGTAGAGTAGADAGSAGAGTAGAGTAGAAPPVVTATTTVIELDDVIVSLKASPDGGVDGSTSGDGGTDGVVADGGTDGVVGDGGVDAISGDGGVDGSADDGSDAATVAPNVGVSYTFDTTALGWKFSPYGSMSLGSLSTDANNPALISTLAWSGTDDADGHSNSGVLKGTVQYKYQGDRIDFQAFTNPTALYNWTGYVVSAKVKLVSGGNLAYGCPIEADIYISDSNAYNTKLSALVNLVQGSWVTVTFDAADALALGVDITKVNQMGLQIDTGPACVGTTPPDAGTDTPTTDGGTSTDAPVDVATSDVAAGN
jgi:hypothetical protein